ncbi:MAG: NAD(P)/FAD-dependent oxidoreductase [Bacteroidota bacterium]
MFFKISQFRVPITTEETDISQRLAEFIKVPFERIKSLKIARKSLDARQRELFFVYTLIFEVELTIYEAESLLSNNPILQPYQPEPAPKWDQVRCGSPSINFRPVITGAGPAGLFAGLRLAAAGFKPIIIERGDGLQARIDRINKFWNEGDLDPESNIQFGIGGAGTFSDGKLTTRIKDPAIDEILKMMVKLGAPPEIRYWQYPHIGTDLLREVINGLQQLISDYGGEFLFRKRLTDIRLIEGKVRGVEVNGAEQIETEMLLLATGNSARDIYRILAAKGLELCAKPFAVGLRIEHPQGIIDKAQYGKWAGNHRLGPAEYHLTYKHQETGRGVYSFCMCPGGFVIGAASEPGRVVTNGMSYHRRDSGIANSAIIVTVNERDYGNHSPLAGVEYQERLEAAAYQLGGGGFLAPAQRVEDFIKKKPTLEFRSLRPSYRPGTTGADLNQILSKEIGTAIAEAIKYFDQKIRGFSWPDATLTGVETRTSAPVRIVRDENRQAIGYSGLYPVGEGAGYAGGIISSALDGWKTAEVVIGES